MVTCFKNDLILYLIVMNKHYNRLQWYRLEIFVSFFTLIHSKEKESEREREKWGRDFAHKSYYAPMNNIVYLLNVCS